MKRKIITIAADLCNGCGLCIGACREDALALVDGKARLISENYCDGLGACLPECPAGAIRIVEREAAPFDEAAATARQSAEKHALNAGGAPVPPPPLAGGCPGKKALAIARAPVTAPDAAVNAVVPAPGLINWPVQIKLAPVNAPYFRDAALLVAADCAAYAYPDIHRRFMAGKVTLIGCPKLDGVDYAEKLTAILRANAIRSVTVLRMEVPCCAGLANATKQAVLAVSTPIPCQVVTISTDGVILNE
ncbi:MAG: 4Fe-4S dicluster domain-containing protein [Kiritimatiellia bacterium]|jgi:NAD-dependent dihydropyrimidine dehydrogenase PreA subunit